MRGRYSTRRVKPAALPRWLRPKLSMSKQHALSLALHVNHDALVRGEADGALLMDWSDGLLMFSRIAERLRMGQPEMARQLGLATTVVRRFEATHRAGLEGDELDTAREGLLVCEALAEACDEATALEAALWVAALERRRNGGHARTGEPA